MSLIEVDTEKCNGCGLCARNCPGRILEMTDDGPILGASSEPLCVACGHCVVICPSGALDHASMAATTCPVIDDSLALDAPRTEQFLRSRRSIRQYRKDEVPPELLARLIRLATYAPSGHNSQPLYWRIFSGADEVQHLARGVGDWMRWLEKEQPRVFEMMGMNRTLEAAARGEDRILRGAPHLIAVHAPKGDPFAPAAAPTALAYLELAAPSLGLGTCWAGYFTVAVRSLPPLLESLCLPEGHEVHGAAMVGYPKARYVRMPVRREPRITWGQEATGADSSR